MAACADVANLEAREAALARQRADAYWSGLQARQDQNAANFANAYWGPQQTRPAAARPTQTVCQNYGAIGATASSPVICTTQ